MLPSATCDKELRLTFIALLQHPEFHQAIIQLRLPPVLTHNSESQHQPSLLIAITYSVHGILQVRVLEWVAIPLSGGSPQPRDWTWVSCIAGRFFTIWATREAPTHTTPLSPCLLCKSPDSALTLSSALIIKVLFETWWFSWIPSLVGKDWRRIFLSRVRNRSSPETFWEDCFHVFDPHSFCNQ